jgi:hypothetical protein
MVSNAEAINYVLRVIIDSNKLGAKRWINVIPASVSHLYERVGMKGLKISFACNVTPLGMSYLRSKSWLRAKARITFGRSAIFLGYYTC